MEEIDAACKQINSKSEIILVDDGSPDRSWEKISEICSRNTHVKGLSLSRNFGQHSAIEAGLKQVTGDWIVVLDCDLQDQPAILTKLWRKANSGAEIVLVRRKARKDAWHRRVLSRSFYKMLSALTGTSLTAEVANFGLYERKVIDTYNSWSEEQKFFPVMIQWLGFEQSYVDIAHTERFSGKSSYNFQKLLMLGLRVVISFSDRPLWFISIFGMAIALLASLLSAIFFIRAVFGDVEVQGWASLILSVWILGGINIAASGFLGIYLGRTLREAKGRPSYIISKTINLERG